MRELDVISIEDGVILGLRFTQESGLCIVKILGAEALTESAHLVQGFETSDLLTTLPSGDRLSEAEIAREQAIHSLDSSLWLTAQTGQLLLHQFRPELRYNVVSPLEALSALQQNLGEGLTYQSTNREVFLNKDSIRILPDETSGDAQAAYVCGPNALGYASEHSNARVLAFRDMPVEIASSLRSELSGLGHLFALIVGAALHLTAGAALSFIDRAASPSSATT